MFANSTEVRLVNSAVSDNFVQSPYGGIIQATPGASVWLENTSMLSNQAVILLSGPSGPDLPANPAVFHSDVGRYVLRDLTTLETQPSPADPSPFLSWTSAWFVDVRKVWHWRRYTSYQRNQHGAIAVRGLWNLPSLCFRSCDVT